MNIWFESDDVLPLGKIWYDNSSSSRQHVLSTSLFT